MYNKEYTNILDWVRDGWFDGLYTRVLEFVLLHPDHFDLADSKASNGKWYDVGQVMKDKESPETIHERLVKLLGEDVTAELEAFVARPPTVTQEVLDILSGDLVKWSGNVAEEIVLLDGVNQELRNRSYDGKELDSRGRVSEASPEWYAQADRLLQFMIDNVSYEASMIAGRRSIMDFHLPFSLRHMQNFDKYADWLRPVVLRSYSELD